MCWRLFIIAIGGIACLIIGLAAERKFAVTAYFETHQVASDEFFTPLGEGYIDLGALVAQQANEVLRPSYSNANTFRSWQAMQRVRLRNAILGDEVAVNPQGIFLRLGESVDVGSEIVRHEVEFESFDGAVIPGYLFVPPGEEPGAGVLVIPGHVSKGKSGIKQVAGITDSYQHGAALQLAKAGFVTLTFELRGFGKLGKPLGTEHRLIAWNAILAGTFYKSVVVRDALIAFELLMGHSRVNASQVGVAGASYGGELSTLLGAIDERVAAVAFYSYGGQAGVPTIIRGHGVEKPPHYCHVIPGSAGWLHMEDVHLLIAPRPAHGARGELDNWASRGFLSALSKGWGAYDAHDKLLLETIPGGRHEFFVEEAVHFFKKALMNCWDEPNVVDRRASCL